MRLEHDDTEVMPPRPVRRRTATAWNLNPPAEPKRKRPAREPVVDEAAMEEARRRAELRRAEERKAEEELQALLADLHVGAIVKFSFAPTETSRVESIEGRVVNARTLAEGNSISAFVELCEICDA